MCEKCAKKDFNNFTGSPVCKPGDPACKLGPATGPGNIIATAPAVTLSGGRVVQMQSMVGSTPKGLNTPTLNTPVSSTTDTTKSAPVYDNPADAYTYHNTPGGVFSMDPNPPAPVTGATTGNGGIQDTSTPAPVIGATGGNGGMPDNSGAGSPDQGQPAKGNNTWIYVAVAIGIIVVALIVLHKKHKK
jgi:hypothetical protein